MSIVAQRAHGTNFNIQVGATRIVLNPYYMGTVGRVTRSTYTTWLVHVSSVDGAFRKGWRLDAEFCGIALDGDGQYVVTYRDKETPVHVRDTAKLSHALAVALTWASHAGNARKTW